MTEKTALEDSNKVYTNDKEIICEKKNFEDNSWEEKLTVQERLALLFQNPLMSDVNFVIGKESEAIRIPAHKLVLSCGSIIFYKMFYGPLKEEHNEIKVPDVGKEAFLCLLCFLYCNKVDLNMTTVMPTIHAANKYMVHSLTMYCWDFVKEHLDSKNVLYVLPYADFFGNSEIMDLCFTVIDNNPLGCFGSDHFTDIDHNMLCSILNRNSLKIKEVDLFRAVLKWAKTECMRRSFPETPKNLRVVAGKAIKLVRFPLMSLVEFSSHVPKSGLLDDKELLELYQYFTVLPKPYVQFSTVQRQLQKEETSKTEVAAGNRTALGGWR